MNPCTCHSRSRSSWRRQRKRDDIGASASQVTPAAASRPEDRFLLCAVASHLGTNDRAALLRRLLTSIDQQVPRALPVHISWHADTHVRKAACLVLLPELSWLSHTEQASAHSQFQHLARLVRTLRASKAPPSWICFSDDDDMWSPNRAELFRHECKKADASGSTVVMCRRKARPHAAVCDGSEKTPLPEPQDAQDVQLLLRKGLAELTDANLADGVNGAAPAQRGDPAFNKAELFDFAVRFELLAEFVAAAPKGMLSHRLCDLGFVRWLRDRCGPIRTFLPPTPTEFVYWYGMALGVGSASHVAIQPQEHELARSHGRLFASAERAAEFLAILRERLEQELVMLRGGDVGAAGGSVAPKQLVDAMCHRQVELLVTATRQHFSVAALPRLHAWVLEQARGPIVWRLLRTLEFGALVCTQTLAVERVCSKLSDGEILKQALGGGA